MRQSLERWVEERLAEAPAELREPMVRALRASALAEERAHDPRSRAARLRAIADGLLDQAMRGSASPETASTLLAADGFATLACELLAEQEPGALEDLR